MDKIDRHILVELQQNAKQNTKEIASKVGLTVTPTYERIKKMETSGVIKRYVALIDKDAINLSFSAFCQITLVQHQKELIDNFKQSIKKLDEVIEMHHVSGNYDFLIKVITKDISTFQEFLNEKLSLLEGISTIQSSIVLDSVIDQMELPISDK